MKPPARAGTCMSRFTRRWPRYLQTNARRCDWRISAGSRIRRSPPELAIPMGTVKTRLRLAFDKLRVSLGPIKDWVL